MRWCRHSRLREQADRFYGITAVGDTPASSGGGCPRSTPLNSATICSARARGRRLRRATRRMISAILGAHAHGFDRRHRHPGARCRCLERVETRHPLGSPASADRRAPPTVSMSSARGARTAGAEGLPTALSIGGAVVIFQRGGVYRAGRLFDPRSPEYAAAAVDRVQRGNRADRGSAERLCRRGPIARTCRTPSRPTAAFACGRTPAFPGHPKVIVDRS